jgi:hypothetical protein
MVEAVFDFTPPQLENAEEPVQEIPVAALVR